MPDGTPRRSVSRRSLLGTLGTAALVIVTGCGGDGSAGEGSTETPNPGPPTPTRTATRTSTATPTAEPTTHTDTTTEQETPTEEPNHDTELQTGLDVRNAGIINEVTDENRDEKTRIGGRFYDEEGIAKFALYVTPEDEKPWRIRTKEHGPKTAEVNESFKKRLLGPGKNTIGLEFWDKEGDKQSFTHTITPPKIQENPGYRIDLKDKHDTITDAASNYSTERRWDDVEATRTEDEWWNMYWNDFNEAINDVSQYGFGNYQHLKEEHINKDVEDPEAMLNSMVAGIHHHIENHTGLDASGATSSIFYAAERKLAKDIWNLDQDQFFSTWITGNKGNHEINFVAYDNNALKNTDEEDWQLKFHNTYASVLTDHAFNHPEQTEYRASKQEFPGQLDGFNYTKLLDYANPDEPEEIHEQPAASLIHFAETSGNDYMTKQEGIATNVVFEKSYLESLEENTYNKNFDKNVLDNLIKAGRTLWEVSEDEEFNVLKDQDFIGIGGELGDEKTYRLNQQQYNEAKESFKYDIWEKAGPENPMNDLSQLITSAS